MAARLPRRPSCSSVAATSDAATAMIATSGTDGRASTEG